MPGNSWRDRLGISAPTNSSPARLGEPPAAAARRTAPSDPANLSPQLAALMQQRQTLENNMQRLVSGQQSPLDRRFHVPTFAERQAEYQRWETRRDSRLPTAQGAPTISTSLGSGELSMGFNQPGLPMRSGLRNFEAQARSREAQARNWLSTRDSERQDLRRRADNALAPLNRVAEPVSSLRDQVGSANRQLRDLDQRLAAEGLEQDRDELRKLGADKIATADNYLGKAQSALNAPNNAVAKIDSFWRDRSNDISGAMDRFGPYVDRAQQRLGLDSGGSGDLFTRMQQNRERAMAQRRERMQQEQRDQARRERALTQKKSREDA